MKIVYLSGGARESALRYLVEHGENVCGVITPFLTESNRRFERVITTAVEYEIPVFQVKREEVEKVLTKLAPDIIVSCGYPYILNKKTISLASYAINVHPTLLPKYRGYRSGAYVLINGEKKTGVTVHFLTEEMDRGDIILQREIDISIFDTLKSVYRKIQKIEPNTLYDAIQLLKSNEFVPLPQNEADATEYLHLRTPKDSEIDPTRPLIDLFNEIRACDPDDYPAFFYVAGQKVCIRLWRPERPSAEEEDAL
jgi:methionyl-tRNA formyltransferase